METKETKKIKILSKAMSRAIPVHVSMRVDDYKFKSLPKFIQKTLSMNKVICYKCNNKIDVGSYYHCSSGGRIRKYYHGKCWESLFQ